MYDPLLCLCLCHRTVSTRCSNCSPYSFCGGEGDAANCECLPGYRKTAAGKCASKRTPLLNSHVTLVLYLNAAFGLSCLLDRAVSTAVRFSVCSLCQYSGYIIQMSVICPKIVAVQKIHRNLTGQLVTLAPSIRFFMCDTFDGVPKVLEHCLHIVMSCTNTTVYSVRFSLVLSRSCSR